VSAEHFEKVQDLFESALLVDESQRDQFLDKKCGKNKKLEKDLRTLLSAQKMVDTVMPRIGNPQLRLAQTDSPNALVGPYQLITSLGSGGMGVVYKAFDIRLERYVALKFLPDTLRHDEHAKKRLIREAKAASALDDQNIGTMYDSGEQDKEQLYIAMAYYEGASIEQYLLQQRFSVEKSLDIIHQLVQGLLTAHRKGIYHRDIKPANLLLTQEGKLKIVDFGIAISKNNMGTDTGIQAGSVSYMSPEQIRGEKSDSQSDLWGCAVIFYELLAGRRPFSGNSLPEIVNRVMNSPFTSICNIRTELPKVVNRWFERALAKKEADRFPDTETFATEFEQLRDGLTTLLSVKKNMAKKSVSGNAMTKKSTRNATDLNSETTIHAISCAIELSNYMDLSDDIDDDAFKNLISAYIQMLETIITEHNGFVHALQKDTFIVKYPVQVGSKADDTRRSAVNASLCIQANVKSLSELHGEDLHCRIALDTLLSDDNNDMEHSIQHMQRILEVINENEIYIDASLKSQIEPEFDLIKVKSEKVASEFSQLWKIVAAKPRDVEAKNPLTGTQTKQPDSLGAPSDIALNNVTNNTTAFSTSDAADSASNNVATKAASTNNTKWIEPAKEQAAHTFDSKDTFVASEFASAQESIEKFYGPAGAESKANPVQQPDSISEQALSSGDASDTGIIGPFVGRLAELDKVKNILNQFLENKKLYINIISGDVGIGSKYFAKKILSMAQQSKIVSYAVAHVDTMVSEDNEPINALIKKILVDLHPKKLSAEHSLVSNALRLQCVESSDLPALHDLLGLSHTKTELRKYRALKHTERQKLISDTAAKIIKFAASKNPLLINIFNIHLAKTEGLSRLANIIGSLHSAPVLINVTSLKNAAKLTRFKALCPQINTISHFELDSLSTAETGKLIGKQGGDINQLEEYLPLTMGNPLHISLLAKARAINHHAGSIEESIDVIVASLAENDRLALRAASVLGTCFSLEALRYLLSNPDYKITNLLKQNLVEANGRYFYFKHELLRNLIYAVVNENSRQTLHQKAAEWYAYVDESIRAYHLQIIDSDEATASTLAAAQEKFSYCHYESTIRLCGKGLTLSKTATDIAKFSVLLGECYVKLDKAELAIEHFKSVLAQCPSERLQCMATLGMVEACLNRKEYQKAENLLDEAKFSIKDGGFSSLQPRLEELTEQLKLIQISA